MMLCQHGYYEEECRFCYPEPETGPEPTYEDQCAASDHAYHGDDNPDDAEQGGRCYCGAMRYPAGGQRTEEGGGER